MKTFQQNSFLSVDLKILHELIYHSISIILIISRQVAVFRVLLLLSLSDAAKNGGF